MGKRRWLPKSPVKAKAIDPTDSRLRSKERKQYKEDLERSRRSERNAQRREQRAREGRKKAELDLQIHAEEVAEAAEEHYEEKLEGLRSEEQGLKKNIARLNARVYREPSRIEHAVQKTLKHSGDPNATLPVVRYVKDRRGIVQDWARNAIVTLVNEGVPISKTWSVTNANAKALDVTIVGKWSTRMSGRVVREGGIAAGLMIMEYILSCICS